MNLMPIRNRFDYLKIQFFRKLTQSTSPMIQGILKDMMDPTKPDTSYYRALNNAFKRYGTYFQQSLFQGYRTFKITDSENLHDIIETKIHQVAAVELANELYKEKRRLTHMRYNQAINDPFKNDPGGAHYSRNTPILNRLIQERTGLIHAANNYKQLGIPKKS